MWRISINKYDCYWIIWPIIQDVSKVCKQPILKVFRCKRYCGISIHCTFTGKRLQRTSRKTWKRTSRKTYIKRSVFFKRAQDWLSLAIAASPSPFFHISGCVNEVSSASHDGINLFSAMRSKERKCAWPSGGSSVNPISRILSRLYFAVSVKQGKTVFEKHPWRRWHLGRKRWKCLAHASVVLSMLVPSHIHLFRTFFSRADSVETKVARQNRLFEWPRSRGSGICDVECFTIRFMGLHNRKIDIRLRDHILWRLGICVCEVWFRARGSDTSASSVDVSVQR